jgi:hypothetical protein
MEMTLKGLSAGALGGWAATLLQRAKGGVIGLALTGILGVLLSQLALAMKWTSPLHYACWVGGSLALYVMALAIGHLGNARELPPPVRDWRAASARVQRIQRAPH